MRVGDQYRRCSWFLRNRAGRRGQTVISTNYTRNCVRGWVVGRGPWDSFDREVRCLQRESLSSDIAGVESLPLSLLPPSLSLSLFPSKLFEFPFKKRACRVTELRWKRDAASFLVSCLFRAGCRGFVCARRVIRNFPGPVYTLYLHLRSSELWWSSRPFSPLLTLSIPRSLFSSPVVSLLAFSVFLCLPPCCFRFRFCPLVYKLAGFGQFERVVNVSRDRFRIGCSLQTSFLSLSFQVAALVNLVETERICGETRGTTFTHFYFLLLFGKNSK